MSRRPAAIGGDEFAALMMAFGPFEADPVLAVAVSGGRDSLCLVLLAQDWAAARGGRTVALIVDHGLRAESASEAAATRDLLAGRGIAAEILHWSGEKPASRLQEEARTARYRLLFEACRRHGILHLLVAHHAADQAETVAMRMARASGPDGLAGMAAVVEHRQARLLRPLLSVPRDRLTATLRERGIPWIEDPSNADPRFERARLRARPQVALPQKSAAGRAARERILAEDAVAMLEVEPPATVVFDRAAFACLGRPRAARLLGRLIQAVAGRPHPPRRDRLDRALVRLSRAADRGKSGKSQDFTLSECRLRLRQTRGDRRPRWIVTPENGRKGRESADQPLVPAAFFACGTHGTPHLE
ncbi:tRNA lysidine(34) synthetase TilS [Enhydrobacter sp.]|uniref:tRNA lysidine(34) synthetase TilS n=1 Tax=Enhydrobacter sp. TaxID=1894999 RepID=UPI00260B6611|nr:tRNA lysidine(34) synthetase TilS [Enhydrobacter sp.]WIM13469.1 MAG: tRNA(Ile)-lysidine synthetase [Enhydrobacter sp.]